MANKWSSRRKFLAGTGLALSAGVAGCSLNAPGTDDTPENELQSPDDADTDQETENAALTEVYEDVVESVAAVRIEDDIQATASGTAWVYEDRYLITNHHVVQGGTDPFVWFTETGWRDATIVGSDVHSDLAVIEVSEKPESATALPLVEDEQPVGTQVAAIGNPFELTGSFTTGVISGQNRTIQIGGRQFSIADGIQTDAALNPGNSGGPLITYDGRVVGVVSAGRGDNIGFAISAAMVERVIPALIEDGEYEHSYLGVGLADVTPAIIEANDLGDVSWGVYIIDTVEGGPADGVLRGTETEETIRGTQVPVGGDVIVRMGDWTIRNRERLSAFLALETTPGDTIEIEVVRDGEREVLNVTLGARSDAPGP